MIGEFIKKHKIAFIAVILLVIGLVGFASYTIVTRAGKEPVSVYLLPSDTKLLINGNQFHEGTVYLAPGTYTIEASRDGFASEKSTTTIGKPNTAAIDLALTPQSNAALKWQQDNQSLYYDYEARSGARAAQKGQEFSEINPITSELPFENLLYTIGYRADPSDPSGNSIIIEIDAASGYRNAALEEIRELGYDPTDYKVNFRNYESPFENE